MHARLWKLVMIAGCALVCGGLAAEAQRFGREVDRGERGGGGWWSKPGNVGSWEKLGEQRVGFQVDRDVMRVGRKEGRFEAVKLRVLGNDIQLISARVLFAGGDALDLRLSGLYRQGSETETVELDRRGRVIEQVELVYRSNPRARYEAVVELWGLHADDRVERPRQETPVIAPPPPRGPAWEMLGERQVDMKVDRDVVKVGRWEGSFTKIRLKVINHDIELRDVTVVYGNGETDQWVIRRRVRDEEEGPVFDLSGRRRVVERIILTYRATNPLSRTSVQVWGGR